MKKLFQKKTKNPGLGLNLKAGEEHYRAFVGPPADYDLISAMVFNLLTCMGLRQHHKVLDIGCGSLRVGRLLIPYLNTNNYFGIEPNKWLVDDGINNEIGKELIKIKQPTFSFCSSMQEFSEPLNLDYVIAQSIFSHCGKNLIYEWISQVSSHMKYSGVLAATFIRDKNDFDGDGWVYPNCVKFKTETMAEIATDLNLNFDILDWAHPRQTWVLFSKKGYDRSLIEGGSVSWNRFIEEEIRKKHKK